jgi:hypothetical protein
VADEQAARFAKFLASAAAPKSEDPTGDLAVKETVAEKISWSDAQIRKSVSRTIMGLFVVVNVFMLGLVVWLAWVDQTELAAKLITPTARLINNQVIIALLGATTVQLGTVAVIMAKYVFKTPG